MINYRFFGQINFLIPIEVFYIYLYFADINFYSQASFFGCDRKMQIPSGV